MSDGYEILSLDDLGRLDSSDGSLTLMPLRRTVGFRPFGVNAWYGAKAGDEVIERHYERGGDQELYVVVRGRATFTLGEQTVDAPPLTLVYAPAGTLRHAVAAEDDTVVLAMGAKPGEAWEPAAWEDFFVAFAKRRAGATDEARAMIADTLARHPDAWQGKYNAACFEALEGNVDAAFALLEEAKARAPQEIAEWAPGDPDFASLHDDPRWQELFG